MGAFAGESRGLERDGVVREELRGLYGAGRVWDGCRRFWVWGLAWHDCLIDDTPVLRYVCFRPWTSCTISSIAISLR